MNVKTLNILMFGLLFIVLGVASALAVEHTHQDGLFSLDVPEGWRWIDNLERVIITYPNGNDVAIDIQLEPSRKIPQDEIKKTLKENDGKMVKEGVEAHQGIVIDDKDISLDGVYARRLDFKSAPQDPVYITYISFFNKDFAYTVTYGSKDEKMHAVMDDIMATWKFR